VLLKLGGAFSSQHALHMVELRVNRKQCGRKIERDGMVLDY